MAELVYLVGRGGKADSYSERNLDSVAGRILPANAPEESIIYRDGDTTRLIINPSNSLLTRGKSVCMGQMMPPRDDWATPGTPVPDGNYGIVREDEETIEVLSDMTASRTLYYYLLDDLFVVSTSQRAIMHFLDSFVPDETAMAWMVSSGSLGPCQTWDRRVNCLPPDSSLQLDRSTWEITTSTGPAWTSFDPVDRSKQYHYDQLDTALERTFSGMELDFSQWHVTLSGGVDSREILRRLQGRPGITSSTRTTAAAIEIPNSDSARAKELADAYDIPHRYHIIPSKPDNVQTVFETMLTLAEGRVATSPRMADGFEEFKSLAANGVDGVIRGDEGFGWQAVGSPTDVRQSVGGEMISDYDILPSLSIPGAKTQDWPSRYGQYPDESLPMWRDRLYHTFRAPVYLAAWNSLKTPYLEIVNPFMTRRVLNAVRELPDKMRTEKQLFRRYVMDRSPDVPEANRSCLDLMAFLESTESRGFLSTELDTTHAKSVLGTEVVEHTLASISPETTSDTGSNQSLFDTVKRNVGGRLSPSTIRRILEYSPMTRPDPVLSDTRLAVRLYTIQSMLHQLENDTQWL